MTVEELSRKIDRVIEDHEKRINQLEAKQLETGGKIDDLQRRDLELDRKIALEVETNLFYYKMIDGKLEEVKQIVKNLKCAQCHE